MCLHVIGLCNMYNEAMCTYCYNLWTCEILYNHFWWNKMVKCTEMLVAMKVPYTWPFFTSSIVEKNQLQHTC
jgi:hypothetical protein